MAKKLTVAQKANMTIDELIITQAKETVKEYITNDWVMDELISEVMYDVVNPSTKLGKKLEALVQAEIETLIDDPKLIKKLALARLGIG